jgi:hypothetical protein
MQIRHFPPEQSIRAVINKLDRHNSQYLDGTEPQKEGFHEPLLP